MNPQPNFRTRNFDTMEQLAGLQYGVSRCSWSVNGGPDQADIEVEGSDQRLWLLPELLRCGVDLWEARSGYFWWGYVESVTLQFGALEVGFKLDTLRNRVAVAYSYITPGTNTVGMRKTTEWIEDPESIAVYGYHELVEQRAGMNDEAANALRNALFEQKRRPGGIPNLWSRKGVEGSATLQCRGYWFAMDWRYANVPAVTAISYQTTSATEQAVGAGTSTQRVMQQFRTGQQAVNVVQLMIYGRKQGSPGDNLIVAIYALDGSGNPTGGALGSGSIAGTSLSASLGWITVPLSNEKELKPDTLYGLQVNRSGAVSGTDYYVVNVNTDLGYSDGVFRIYSGTWAGRTPDADLPFQVQVNNKVSTTQQISDLVQNFGQIFTSTIAEIESGVSQGSYQDGDTTALQVVEGLLKVGGPNNRRLLVSVTRDRRVILTEEPAAPDQPIFSIDSENQIWEGERQVTEIEPPLGQWVRLRNSAYAPSTISLTSLESQFVEGAEWTPEGGMQIQFRGQPSISELTAVLP